MGSNSSAAKRYIRSVSDMLSCSGKTKKRIVSQIRYSVDEYLLQHPDADFEMIQTHFGTPQEIAASYVNAQDAAVLLKKMSIKKKVLVIVASVMAVILLVWIGYIGWATIDTQKISGGQVEVIVGEK
jgi:hypothetical protein